MLGVLIIFYDFYANMKKMMALRSVSHAFVGRGTEWRDREDLQIMHHACCEWWDFLDRTARCTHTSALKLPARTSGVSAKLQRECSQKIEKRNVEVVGRLQVRWLDISCVTNDRRSRCR